MTLYQSDTADIVALKQSIQILYDLMRQSGVGALPVIPAPSDSSPAVVPTEEMMLADTTKSVGLSFEKMKRAQESAAVVANLLGAGEHGHGGRGGGGR